MDLCKTDNSEREKHPEIYYILDNLTRRIERLEDDLKDLEDD